MLQSYKFLRDIPLLQKPLSIACKSKKYLGQLFASIKLLRQSLQNCTFRRDKLVPSLHISSMSRANSHRQFMQWTYFNAWYLMNTMPITCEKSPMIFLYALRAKTEPLRKRHPTRHKSRAHVERGSIVAGHILAKAGISFWRKKWRKIGK